MRGSANDQSDANGVLLHENDDHSHKNSKGEKQSSRNKFEVEWTKRNMSANGTTDNENSDTEQLNGKEMEQGKTDKRKLENRQYQNTSKPWEQTDSGHYYTVHINILNTRAHAHANTNKQQACKANTFQYNGDTPL